MTSSNVPLPHSSPITPSSESALPLTRDEANEKSINVELEPTRLLASTVSISTITKDAPSNAVDHLPSQNSNAPGGISSQRHFRSWRFFWWTNMVRNSNLPRYRLPFKIMLAAIASSFRNQKRSVRVDTAKLVASMPVPPEVRGIENLPETRPFVILPNHYERTSGAWVGWGAIVITNAIARARPGDFPIRWVMTSTWQDCYLGPKRIHPKYLHWILRRMSNLFGIILMPADDVDAFGRGAALRDMFRALVDPVGQVVAFHPEAGGFETMITPPKGMGRVLAALDHQHIQMIPTGVYEESGRFQVRFGKAIDHGSLQGLSDTEATNKVMLHIAALVPERTRGDFAEQYRELKEPDTVAVNTAI